MLNPFTHLYILGYSNIKRKATIAQVNKQVGNLLGAAGSIVASSKKLVFRITIAGIAL